MKYKKINSVVTYLIMTLCLMSISACSTQSQKLSNTKEQSSFETEIKTNKKKWNNKIKNIPVVKYPKVSSTTETIEEDHYNFSFQLVEGLKDSKLNEASFFKENTVINATIVNYKEMKDKVISPTTEVTIFVNKVLSGSKSLKGRTIKTEFGGGLTKVQYLFSDVEGNYYGKDYGYNNPDTKVFADNLSFPMPKIGSKIVTQVENFSTLSKGQQKYYETKYKLTSKNFYPIKDPYILFWIKKGNKYQLNNPGFVNIQNDEIEKITSKVNKLLYS